jgi:hypothetical protein
MWEGGLVSATGKLRPSPFAPLSGSASSVLGSGGRWLGCYSAERAGTMEFRASTLGVGWGGGWQAAVLRTVFFGHVAWCGGRPNGHVASDLEIVVGPPYGAQTTSPAADFAPVVGGVWSDVGFGLGQTLGQR